MVLLVLCCVVYVFTVWDCSSDRKRQRSGGDEQNGQLVPQAKRQSRTHPLSPEPGHDACENEVIYHGRDVDMKGTHAYIYTTLY